MINCILSQTYSRFTNFAFKPTSRFTYSNAYANRKQTSKFELCKEVNFMEEVYGLCSAVVSFEYYAGLKKHVIKGNTHVTLTLPSSSSYTGKL